MRERLIGLIQDSVDGCARHWAEVIADYLLENGVVVPPCKVGQTIYYHFQFSNKRILPFVQRAKVKQIFCLDTKMKFKIEVELIDAKEKGIMKFFNFDDFGKTVFLTREEAEAKLKGGAEE